MAIRKCGNVTINITYHDDGTYKGSVSCNGYRWHFDDLRAPVAGLGQGIAYDSPSAYDSMAGSAISFAVHHNRYQVRMGIEGASDEFSSNSDMDKQGNYLIEGDVV